MENRQSTGGGDVYHINKLELIAAGMAIKTFVKAHNSIHVYLHLDNVTPKTYGVFFNLIRSRLLHHGYHQE